jgi:FkbM family methyltransferase
MTAWPRRFPIAIDPVWFWRNIATSWSRCAGITNAARYMLWLYSARLPRACQRDWTIRFRYPEPIGSLALRLRSNEGADGFIRSEVFENQCYRLPLAEAPATVLDLGANIGLSTIYFSRLFPGAQLACVEPEPQNLRLLAQNLELNGVDAAVFAAAVDVRDGTVRMERASRDYGHRIAGAEIASSAGQFEVPALSVRSLLRQLGWTRVGLVKIDIEGHETCLLTEAFEWLEQVDALCLEYHEHGAEEHLARIARQFGFAAPRRLPWGIWLLVR